MFNKGCLRTFNKALFSLLADISAFKAAAVDVATFGVVPEWLAGDFSSDFSPGDGVICRGCGFTLALRVLKPVTFSRCCSIATSMLRQILLMVSREGALGMIIEYAHCNAVRDDLHYGGLASL